MHDNNLINNNIVSKVNCKYTHMYESTHAQFLAACVCIHAVQYNLCICTSHTMHGCMHMASSLQHACVHMLYNSCMHACMASEHKAIHTTVVCMHTAVASMLCMCIDMHIIIHNIIRIHTIHIAACTYT